MWQDKRIYLIGAGKSGLAAARWLLDQGARVCLSDIKKLDGFRDETQKALWDLTGRGLELQLGSAGEPAAWQAALVVASPGVPLDQEGILAARAAGIPVTNEIELAWQVCRARIVAVTGSNGKTTVTSLIGRILDQAGFQPFVGGNIGTPFIEAAPGLRDTDWAVLELSSFQLEGLLSLRPRVAVFLNLTPDHLDWHKSFDSYEAAKWRIASFQEAEDWLILNYDDERLRREGLARLQSGRATAAGPAPGHAGGPRILWFSTREQLELGLIIDGEGWVCYNKQAGQCKVTVRIMPAAEFSLPGAHNLENMLAAAAACLVLGVRPDTLRQCVAGFGAVEHRMEPVGEWGGVLYVNDSKATNPDAAIKAMDSYSRPLLLIAGGDGKQVSFQELAAKIVEKAKLTVVLGKDGEKIAAALSDLGYDACRRAETLEEAVQICQAGALPGDMVLLAPACASLDMFLNYEQRGNVFKAAVRALCQESGRKEGTP